MLLKVSMAAKTIMHVGFIPLIIVLGMANGDASWLKIISPLA